MEVGLFLWEWSIRVLFFEYVKMIVCEVEDVNMCSSDVFCWIGDWIFLCVRFCG